MVDTAQQRAIFQFGDENQRRNDSYGVNHDIRDLGRTCRKIVLDNLDTNGIEKQNNKTLFTCKPGISPLEKQKKGEKSDEVVDDVTCGNSGGQARIIR